MLETQETQQQALVMVSSALSAAREPPLPPNPGPGEATADDAWLEVATGTPRAALCPLPDSCPGCGGDYLLMMMAPL